ncbi:hypothetical protein CVT24_004856 [Panaeolus cyanescens]|uniref:Uncharacterized protein n=1 Tax=Panaeolus cyanescens TaxID=181874 RepID=A0A409VC24_9AGAR|nr:hypothetical protein CVT24_004856 [Panaeolus cyanescens]
MARFKNRWILVEFIPINKSTTQGNPGGGTAELGKPSNSGSLTLDGKKIWNSLRQSVASNFGDTGWGKVGLSLTVKYFSPMTNLCIIRVARDQHNIAWAALTLLSSIDGMAYIPNVIHVSGTIKHAQLAAIAHNRIVVARYRALSKMPVQTLVQNDGLETYLETSEKEINAMQD